MASNYTENYGLCQWEATDQVLRTEFNEDNTKIDTALGEMQDSIASQAEAIKLCGNCKIVAFSYTGTGGETSRVNFPERPTLFIIQGGTGMIIGGLGKTATLAASGASITSTQVNKISMKWSGGQLTLTDSSPYWVLNASNIVYQVIAFYLVS